MNKKSLLTVLALTLMLSVSIAIAGTATPHLISLQGVVTDTSGEPVPSGDLRVRIYDAETVGTEVWNSGDEHLGAIVNGIFDVLLGSQEVTNELNLDNTQKYYMEIDVNGGSGWEEVVGDATSGRQKFWPGGGEHPLPDLDCIEPTPVETNDGYCQITCPSDRVITGGGCYQEFGKIIIQSIPDGANGWYCELDSIGTVGCHAVCCKLV